LSRLVPVVIDSDGGCDDAAALWFALTDARLDVLAVTAVWGNTDVQQAAANLRQVCEAAGRPEVPVAVGAAAGSAPGPLSGRRRGFHGQDGLGGHAVPPRGGPVPEPAVDLLLRVTAERPKQVTVLAIGPQTNLAAAIEADPSFPARVRRLVVMGGSARRGGNAGPWTEANVGHDPTAAARVALARWASPPLLVGLDVTLAAPIGPDEIALLEAKGSAAAAFLAGPLAFHRASSGSVAGDGTQPVHDLVAACAVADPGIVTGPIAPLAVDTAGGPAWGMTVVDLRGGHGPDVGAGPGFAPWQVGTLADGQRFRHEVRRMLG
jgi:purine nucleosidase